LKLLLYGWLVEIVKFGTGKRGASCLIGGILEVNGAEGRPADLEIRLAAGSSVSPS